MLGEEHRRKITEALRKPETRAKMSASNNRLPLSDERKRKMIEGKRRNGSLRITPEHRAKLVAAVQGLSWSEKRKSACRPVQDQNGIRYYSVTSAARETGNLRSWVDASVKQGVPTPKGDSFSYCEGSK